MSIILNILDLINDIILLLLGLSTLIGILDFIGFLPRKVRNLFRVNRSEDTIDVLNGMGFDLEQYRRIIQAHQYPRMLLPSEVENVVFNELKQYKINKEISVGRHRRTALPYYYDLIGASCDPDVAKYFAKILSTYWSIVIEQPGEITNADVDFVVTPKGGSPILGYEFAAAIGKPFVLFEETERFQSSSNDMRSHFNCHKIPPQNATALIVDDSTTGGHMVFETIENLRRYGYRVHTCLVVFVPQVKNVEELLRQKHVQLVSIIKTHCPHGNWDNNTSSDLPEL